MQFLSQADQNFLNPFTAGPKLIERKAMCSQQGNGNFTGYWLNTWSDGRTSRQEVVMNARTVAEVRDCLLAS